MNQSATLLLEYHSAFDIVALTPRNARVYVQRWTELARTTERLYAAQHQGQIHHDRHQQFSDYLCIEDRSGGNYG
jgi:hypothetical protein